MCSSVTLKNTPGIFFIGLIFLWVTTGALAQQADGEYKKAYRYNLKGQVTGEIFVDPDGTGPLPRIAVRNTYNPQGMLSKKETGTLSTWQDDTIQPVNWGASFVPQNKTEYEYDDYGRQTKITVSTTTETVSVTHFSYNSLHQLECKAVRMQESTFNATDACAGELADRITKYTFDVFDNPLVETRAYGHPELEQDYVTYTYDSYKNKTSVTDANGNYAELRYDSQNRLKKWVFPSKTTTGQLNENDYEEYAYDNNGNRTGLTRRNKKVISYTYDNLNRMTLKDLPDTTTLDVYYGYDNRDLQTYARFGSNTGAGITTQYDGFGRIESATNNTTGTPRTLSYQYDENSNRTRVTHPDSAFFEYQYDNADRLTYILEDATQRTDANQLIAQTWYDDGMPYQTRFGSAGLLTELKFDDLSRLEKYTHTFSLAAHNTSVEFGYNAASQVAYREYANQEYLYTQGKQLFTDYQVNGLNQYKCIGTADTTCSGGEVPQYDANGNLTRFNDERFAFDVENRLISHTKDNVVTNFTYDPMGRLMKAEKGSESIEFLYDGEALVAEYQGGSMTARYVHGSAIDNPLVSYNSSAIGSANRVYLHKDHQGSIVAHSDNAGTRIRLNSYDEYGIPENRDIGRFAYTGQAVLPFSNESTAEETLYHYKARVYHPKLGRFLQTDPVGYEDQVNLYTYVANDPMTNIDPSGESLVHAFAFAVGAAVSGYQAYKKSGGDFAKTAKAAVIGGASAALSLSPGGIIRNVAKSFAVGVTADATSQVAVDGKGITEVDVGQSLEAGVEAAVGTATGAGVSKLVPTKNMPSVGEPSVPAGRTQRTMGHPGTIKSDKAKQMATGAAVGAAAGLAINETQEQLNGNQ